MGFSDNLENDLKNLESASERDPAEAARRQADREAARIAGLAAQPHAQQLRQSPFTAELLDQATVAGHRRRIPVRILWMGQSLRLHARDHILELRPTPDGVEARFLRGVQELAIFPVDFASNPGELAGRWLGLVSETTGC
mgnify:CR=1 FL=1